MRTKTPLGLLASCLLAFSACRSEEHDIVQVFQQTCDSCDQLMIGLKQNMTKEGVRQAYLEADSAFIYETRGHVDLKHIRVTFFSQSGEQTSVLTALGGSYNMRTNLMDARGNVVVVRSDGGRLTTSHLIYDQPRNEVRTDSAYTYTSAERQVEGDGFVSDPTFTNIQSRRLRGRAGGFTLPNQ
jgi:LPS export ABC transporter protein LptC